MAHGGQKRGLGLTRGFSPMFRLGQRFERGHLAGEIVIDADHAKRFPRGVMRRARDGLEVMHRAVRPQHAKPGFVGPLAAQSRLNVRLHSRTVIGMNRAGPGIVRATEVAAMEPIELIHDVVPHEHIVGNVPIPHPHNTGRPGGLQTLVFLREISRRRLGVGHVAADADQRVRPPKLQVRFGAGANPPPAAGNLHAVLHLEARRRGGAPQRFQGVHQRRYICGMTEGRESRPRGGQWRAKSQQVDGGGGPLDGGIPQAHRPRPDACEALKLLSDVPGFDHGRSGSKVAIDRVRVRTPLPRNRSPASPTRRSRPDNYDICSVHYKAIICTE